MLVAGAGLAGLSTAHHMRSGTCLIVEREKRPGGLATTTWEKGYGFDRTGHLLHLRDPGIARWVGRLVGRDSLRIERLSRIWSSGAYTRYPFQANTFGLPPRVAYECLAGFFEARDASPVKAVRSFEDFILRHFGQGFARHFMIPYNTKIWGVHPRDMTPAWCDRFVPVPTVKEVLSGAVGLADPELGYNARFLYPRRGIGVLSDRIADDVGRRVPIGYGLGLTGIEARRRRARLSDGSWVSWEALVTTVPLDALVKLIVDAPAWIREAGRRLRVRPLRYLDIALEVPAGTPWHWTYVPDPGVSFYRVGAYSNFSPDVVPEGCGSLYVELVSQRGAPLRAVMSRVLPELIRMGLLRSARDVRFVRERRIPHAYVVYDHAWESARGRIHRFLSGHSIYSIGRYGDWNYSAMEDALIAGRQTARAIEEGSSEELA